MEVISRRVGQKRRVGLPRSLAARSGIEPEQWVTVSPMGAERWVLHVRPAGKPATQAGLRDPDRPRRVTRVLQVTVPQVWMERVELEPGAWVFLTSLGPGAGLSMVPQTKAQYRGDGIDLES